MTREVHDDGPMGELLRRAWDALDAMAADLVDGPAEEDAAPAFVLDDGSRSAEGAGDAWAPVRT